MRIGILSINLHTRGLNYGAVLHSWASQQLMLRRNDVDSCEVIDYKTPCVAKLNLKYPILSERPGVLLKPRSLIKSIMHTYTQCRRFRKFERFIRKNMIVSEKAYIGNELALAQLPYDTLLIESDVIWSTDYLKGTLDPAFFGALPSMKDMRRVVYAASMGGSIFNEAQTRAFINLLKYPDAISVRETYNAEITRRYTDKPVQDVLDPVMLLDREDFEKLIHPPKRKPRKPFVVVYFPVEPRRQVVRYAQQYAEKRGWQVLEISYQPWNILYNPVVADAGIEEFLWFIMNAEAVFSNSLHGTLLSILFHKEFFCFERSNGKKYKDICEKMNIEGRYFLKSEQFDEAKAQPLDWDKIDRRKRELREESLKWLDAALKRQSFNFKLSKI